MSGTALLGPLRLPQLSAPSNPASGQNLLYPKSDGIWYTKDATGTERAIVDTDHSQTLSNKTLIAPTISGTDWALAQHAHSDADTGGVLTLATAMRDESFKTACVVSTETLGNVTLSGGAPSVVDGVSLAFADRVLVVAQTTTSQNGIYRVITLGTGSNGTWMRTADSLASAIVPVVNGSSGSTLWRTTFKFTDTGGVSAMSWYKIADLSSVQSLSNKTLVSPAFKDGGGATTLFLESSGATANYVTLLYGTSPGVKAAGASTDLNINLQPKGTGIATANGVAIATISDTQTLTNKTLSAGTKVGAATTDISGAWTSYTPTLTNVTLGTGGTANGAYVQIGKTVHFRAGFTLGTSGTLTGAAIITLPVAPATAPRYPFMGLAYDNSATTPFQVIGICVPTSANITVRASPATAGGALAATSATIPIAWAISDTLEITGSYEAA